MLNYNTVMCMKQIFRKNKSKVVWKSKWFVLFKKKSSEFPEIDEFVLFHKNDSRNLNDDYMVTYIDLKTITGIKYISKNDRKIIQLQYCYKNDPNNQLLHLSTENTYCLTEWFDEISKAKEYMRENISLDGEFISRIQDCPLHRSVNPRYDDKLEFCNLSTISSSIFDRYNNDKNIYYIGSIQFPPKYFPFEHDDTVVLTIQDDNIYLKPAMLTVGGVERTRVMWPLSCCSRFGSSKDCFFVEVDQALCNHSNNVTSPLGLSSSTMSSSGIFCIKSHMSSKILKDILKYCKKYKNKEERDFFASFVESSKSKNYDPLLEIPTSNNKLPQRRKSFFHSNSIYNYAKNDTIIDAKSILKNPKKFFTLRRTKNN